MEFVYFFNSKLFDPEMTPITFSKEEMFAFITERFDGTPTIIQEQSLSWLQVTCINYFEDIFQNKRQFN